MSNGDTEVNFEKCQELCDAFLNFDFENGDIDEFVRKYVRPVVAMETDSGKDATDSAKHQWSVSWFVVRIESAGDLSFVLLNLTLYLEA